MRTIEELRAGIAYIGAILRAMHDLATGESRSLTEDETRQWSEGEAWIVEARAELEQLEARQRLLESLPTDPPVDNTPPAAPGQMNDRGSDPLEAVRALGQFAPAGERARVNRDAGMRAVEAAEQDGLFVSDEHRDAMVARLHRRRDPFGGLALRVATTQTEDYLTAFPKLLSGRDGMLTAAERDAVDFAERAAFAVGSDPTGGYLVPTHLDPTIILTNDGAINPWRELARNVDLPIGGPNTWNGVTSAGATASYDAEAEEVSDDTPTLGPASISTHMARGFVQYSIEAEQDIGGLSEDIIMILGDAKDTLESDKFANGTGTGEPDGVVRAVAAVAGRRQATAGVGAFVAGDVYAVRQLMAARYRKMGMSWVANDDVVIDLRQFGSTEEDFLVDMAGDDPDRLLGRPLHVCDDMDADSTNTGDDIMIIGAFSNFIIVEKAGMTVEAVRHIMGANRRPTGERGTFAHWRNGSGVVNTSAFAVLRVA